MEITYLGHSSFKVKTKSGTVITDPYDPKMVGLKYSGVEGEIVTVSHQHPDHNALSVVSGVKKTIQGPGEYEIAGVSIVGYPSFHDGVGGSERGKNTIYAIEAEGLRIVHLGDLGHIPSEDLINEIGDVDVLMIPVGGTFTIGPKEAAKVVSEVEPYFVIPMHYNTPGLNPETFSGLLGVEDFIKASELPVENLSKFSIKKEDIMEDQNTKIVVLERK